eukprot:g10952.t1
MRQYTMLNGAKSMVLDLASICKMTIAEFECNDSKIKKNKLMQMLTQQRKRVDLSANPGTFGLKLCPFCFLYIHGIAASTTARTWVQAALRGEDGSRKAASRRPSQKRSNTMEFLDDILATMTVIGPTDGYKKVLGATNDEYLKTMEIFFRTLSLQAGYKVGGLKISSFYSLWHDKYSDFIVSSSSLHGFQLTQQHLTNKKEYVQTTHKLTEDHHYVYQHHQHYPLQRHQRNHQHHHHYHQH